jgi:hypothetical protein
MFNLKGEFCFRFENKKIIIISNTRYQKELFELVILNFIFKWYN